MTRPAAAGQACDDCLRRTDLVAALAGRIEIEWRRRRGRPQVLGLADEDLLAWAGEAEIRRRYASFAPAAARARIAASGLAATCRCSATYPAGLRDLPDPPAVLHHGVGWRGCDDGAPRAAVAVVGARRVTPYGTEVAHLLGRGLAASGVTVVSGMALGVDAAAHAGALAGAGAQPEGPAPAGGGATVAVLAGGADVPYPPSKRGLHARIAARGAVVSEMPPGFKPFRWTFPARNRIIAALSCGTVVVEGGERSGSLITADFAADLGRFVAAVPGAVTARNSAGPNLLIKSGAELVRGVEDVLDLVHGVGGARPGEARPAAAAGEVALDEGALDAGPRDEDARERAPRQGAVAQGSVDQSPVAPSPVAQGPAGDGAELPRRLRDLLDRVEAGQGSVSELARTVEEARRVASDLGELELRGLVRRTFGGRYVRAA